MKPRNYYVYNNDADVLKGLQEDYESMGRDTKIEGNRLCVFATVQKKAPVKKKFDRKDKSNDPLDNIPSPEVDSKDSRSQAPKRKE